MRTALVTTIACFTLAACQLHVATIGSGAVITQTREVGAFKRLSVEGPFVVHVSTGARAVTVRADDNFLPLIETVLEGDTLVARLTPGTSVLRSTALELTVVNDAVEAVSASGAATVTAAATPASDFPVVASGASHVDVSGLSATNLHVTASGASSVVVAGAASSGTLIASGASSVDVRTVSLQSATIDISGGSNLKATVTSTLTGSLSGGSSAVITGTPSSSVNVSGGSTLTH